MITSLNKAAVVGLSALLAAGSASAASYTFIFDNSIPDDQDVIHVMDTTNTLGVTISGLYYTPGATYNTSGTHDVDSNSWGLISQNGEQHTLDSLSPYGQESFQFVFDGGKEVSLTDVDISWSEYWYFRNGSYRSHGYSASDAFGVYDLFADGDFVGNSYDGEDLPAGPANEYAIGAASREWISYYSCDRYGRYDRSGQYTCEKEHEKYYGFKIRSITVEYEDTPQIPLPAAGWMLIAGLGGMAALRRKKA